MSKISVRRPLQGMWVRRKFIDGDGRRTWSEDDDRNLHLLHELGDRVQVIAKKLGRDAMSISNRLQHLKRQHRLARLIDKHDLPRT
jgi:hypothetical protein